ncbi:PLxRFG domain-containing protein [Acinetobacter guerrae]|uniref:PLxRFG domain-containing protein n=1 Tax=Acinetobacter guerrae TaxID=1843371 RepID=UPI00125ED218|nr:PLxRFG domain-containing protein [Acinetobacter guerrae]
MSSDVETDTQYSKNLLSKIAKLNPDIEVIFTNNPKLASGLSEGGHYPFTEDGSEKVYIYPQGNWESSILNLVNHELVHAVTHKAIIQNKVSQEDLSFLNHFSETLSNWMFRNPMALNEWIESRFDYGIRDKYDNELIAVFTAETDVRKALTELQGQLSNESEKQARNFAGSQKNDNGELQQTSFKYTGNHEGTATESKRSQEDRGTQYQRQIDSNRTGKTRPEIHLLDEFDNVVHRIMRLNDVQHEQSRNITDSKRGRSTEIPSLAEREVKSDTVTTKEHETSQNTERSVKNLAKNSSNLDTVFGVLNRSSAIDRILSFFDHLKMTATQDSSSGQFTVHLDKGRTADSFKLQVVSSFDDLPKIIQQAATYQDEHGKTQNYSVSGVWHDDTLYVVTDQINGDRANQFTTSDAYEELLTHEIIGHYGVQRIFGTEYKNKFQQLYNALGGELGILKIAHDNGVDMEQFKEAYIEPFKQGVEEGYYDAVDAQQASVSELFAFVAQNAEKKPFVRQKLKEVLGYIRQWLREHGLMKLLQYNDADIMMFIAEARKAVVNRDVFGKYGNQTISKNNSDKLFSRGQSASQTNTTVKDVRNKLVDRFGNQAVTQLEKQGKLEILDTYQEAGIEGFYQNGKVTLVADALNAESIIPTFLHELGGHGGFQNMMESKQYDDLMRQFDRLVEQNNPIALEAKRLAERESDPNVQRLEMLPYLLTLASNTHVKNAIHKGKVKGLINDLISKIKAWIFDRLGLNINLNPDDMVALAERMIDKASVSKDVNNQNLYSRQSMQDTIDRLSQNLKEMSIKSIKDKTGYKWTDWLGVALSTLGRRQLTEIYSKILPQLNKYNELAAQMDADKNDAGAEADTIVREWSKLKQDKELAELMHDSTLAQIDPSKPFATGDNRLKYNQLRQAYDSLDPEAQAMYKQARDAYKKHYAKVHQAIKERILRSELSSQKKADLLKQMDDNFFNGYVKGVYFPLARFGKYVVVMRNSNNEVQSVSRAETMGEAQALRSELMQKYPHYKIDKVKLDKEYNKDRDAVGRGFMTNLFAEVDNLGLSTAEQAEFEDTLSQLYLSSLPDLSWAKHGIHRKGTPGFSQDARRAFAQNMFHGAGYLAKLRYGDQLAQQLDEMQKHADKQFIVDDEYDQRSAQRVITEMNKRHELLMNPKSHPLSSALTSLGFIYYLGLSPAAAMVNLSQTALVAYPVMGAKWGFDKAATELLKASNDFRKGVEFHKVKWEGSKTDLYKTMSADISKFLSKDEKQAYDDAVARGVIDVTQAHDLAGIAQGEDSGIMWKTRPVMRAASVMFHHAERFNREVTFIAAYRLARQAGSNHNVAFDQAVDATYKGHFDYSAGNRPRIMQGDVAKVLLLFKQFGQNMIYTLARQTYQSIKGETKAERKEALKTLGAILAMHMSLAGALGLPLVGMMLSAASAMGGDDDDPWDAEVALRNYLAEAFGPTISNLLMKGAPRALTPIDMSGRVGINNLLFPDVQEGLEGKSWWDATASAALGPVGGIGANLAKGTQEISEGRGLRGLETMLPVFLKNFAKTYRYGDEGLQDKTGISIVDEVNSMDLLVQGMGFSPSDVRTAYEGKTAIYQLDKKLNERRGRLMALWSRARMLDDQGEMDSVWSDIQEFNDKNPSRRITRVNLQQSYRNRQRRIDKAEDGIYLTSKHQDAREAGYFAFGD